MWRSRTDGLDGASAKPTCWDARDSSCDAFSSRSPTVPARRSRASTSGCTADALARPEQAIDVQAIAGVGRHAAGRGVRLVDQSLFLEAGEDVPHRGRRQAQVGVLRQPGRRHGFSLLDVLRHQAGENPPLAFEGFVAHVGLLAVSNGDCQSKV